MNIQWLGQACFRVTEKIDGQEVAAVFAPFGKEVGLFPPKIKADVIISNRPDELYGFADKVVGAEVKEPFVIDRPGEYETRKVFVNGLERRDKNGDGTVLYRVALGSITLGHLGGLNEPLNEKEIEFLGDIDILLVPVGGDTVLDGARAAEVVRQIEPRIVIPMEYKIKGVTLKLSDESKLLKEMGGTADKESNKFKVTRKSLPEDNTKVVVLEKS